jgi:hypothetical protein
MIELCEHKRNGSFCAMTTLTRGQFSGELDLLSGREVLLSCRAAKRSQILRVEKEDLRRLMRTELDIADLFVDAWIGRRAGLVQHSQGGVIVMGYGHDADTTRTQQFLVRNGYRALNEKQLAQVLTSNSGETRRYSLPAGSLALPVQSIRKDQSCEEAHQAHCGGQERARKANGRVQG